MGVATCPCKIVLGIINGVILLAGLVLAAAGGLLIALTANPNLLGDLNEIINKILGSISIVSGDSVENPVSDDILSLVQPAGIALLVVGLVILAISIIGYCGLSCCDVLLKVYVIVLIVILLVEVVAVIVLFTGVFNDRIQSEMKGVISKEYEGIDGSSFYSIIPNILMIQFKCCGINGYEDFDNATEWHRRRNITVQGHSEEVTLVTPIACCKTTGTFPNVNVVDEHCATDPNNDISNWNIGCWQAISDSMSKYAIPVTVIALLAQAAVIVMLMIIICMD